jgi:hypothetical protein
MGNPNFVDAVETLKTRLRVESKNYIEEFEAITGITPRSVEIRMLEATPFGSPIRKFVVENVVLRFDL